MRDYASEIASVEAAIAQIESNGQSLSVAGPTGKSITRANLETLYKRLDYLHRMEARSKNRANRIKPMTRFDR